jgi:hypothetical protein
LLSPENVDKAQKKEDCHRTQITHHTNNFPADGRENDC